MTWTVERVEELKRLWAEGWSGTQIGAALGITRNAVIGKANRLHLTPRVKAPPRPKGEPRLSPSLNPKALRTNRGRNKKTPAAYRKPVPPPPPPPMPPACQPISMMAMPLTGRCRFPVAAWTGPKAPFYCGSPDMAPGSSYCRWHRRIAHGEGTHSERRADQVDERTMA